MIEKENVEKILERLRVVEDLLAAPDTAADQKKYRDLVREHASLRKLQDRAAAYFRLLDTAEGDRAMVADPSTDAEMRELAQAELAEAEAALPAAEKSLSLALLPPDPDEHRNALLEIRAGTGGDEAALFAGDLFRMYSRYCEIRGWKVQVLSNAPSELGGYKEISFRVEGDGAYFRLRYEGGGHRVQRVPETEAQGRIHTSAATVAAFPEAEPEDELVIRNEDLRIDTYRSGGAGGQHVNKTDSAIRIRHVPTGIVVTCDAERSQFANRKKAMAILRAKVYEYEEDRKRAALERFYGEKGSISWGNQIRSYVLQPYTMAKDLRTGHETGNVQAVLDGDLAPFIAAWLKWKSAGSPKIKGAAASDD